MKRGDSEIQLVSVDMFNTVKSVVYLNYVQNFSSYITENATRLHYKDQLFNGPSPWRTYGVT